jgi:hypothetical protein
MTQNQKSMSVSQTHGAKLPYTRPGFVSYGRMRDITATGSGIQGEVVPDSNPNNPGKHP